VRTRSYIAESTSPLDPVGRRIARQHLESARDELADRLDADDRATVRRLLDPTDPASIDHRDDLTVTAVRTVHAATTGPSRERERGRGQRGRATPR
jgi:hypothetical protein